MCEGNNRFVMSDFDVHELFYQHVKISQKFTRLFLDIEKKSFSFSFVIVLVYQRKSDIEIHN